VKTKYLITIFVFLQKYKMLVGNKIAITRSPQGKIFIKIPDLVATSIGRLRVDRISREWLQLSDHYEVTKNYRRQCFYNNVWLTWYTDDSANLTFAELVFAELVDFVIFPNRTYQFGKKPIRQNCLKCRCKASGASCVGFGSSASLLVRIGWLKTHHFAGGQTLLTIQLERI
jgi:hypothetical protein